MIPNSRPSVGDEELAEVRKVFESGWLGMGSVVFEFEKAIGAYLGAEKVVAVNTGTSAMHIALDALGIWEGDEVIVPSLTFGATVQVILACRATPVFCEVNPRTLNLDMDDVRRRITPRTKAIIPVHYGGLSCDMDELLALKAEKGIRIVEDAAHAFGSLYKGRKIGSFGDVTCFSFDPIKTVTCGEGGAVVVNGDAALREEIVRKRILGIDKDTWHRYRNERSWFYEITTTGYRYHMSNINAAIGLVQLRKADEFIRARRRLVRLYDAALRDVPSLELLDHDYDGAAPFNYVVRVRGGRRNALLDALAAKGIVAGVHYIPNHLQPVFKPFAGPLPATEAVWEEILSLPLYSSLTDADLEIAAGEVRSFLSKS